MLLLLALACSHHETSHRDCMDICVAEFERDCAGFDADGYRNGDGDPWHTSNAEEACEYGMDHGPIDSGDCDDHWCGWNPDSCQVYAETQVATLRMIGVCPPAE